MGGVTGNEVCEDVCVRECVRECVRVRECVCVSVFVKMGRGRDRAQCGRSN